jgi:AcrR family transcriptional regulator
MPKMKPADSEDQTPPDSPTGRILSAAQHRLFNFGYASFTMDDLAQELGMSKKTLYVHFPGKESIVDRIIDQIGEHIRTKLDAITLDPKRTFVQKLCALVDTVGGMLSKVSPHLLRDLQRYTPGVYQKIDQLRQKNIPIFFSRIIRDGIAQRKVRADIDPDFAAQFWLQAIRGLLQPDVLERTQLSPRQTLEQAIQLFFGGLLTDAGRLDYEKHLADCRKHRDPA